MNNFFSNSITCLLDLEGTEDSEEQRVVVEISDFYRQIPQQASHKQVEASIPKEIPFAHVLPYKY